MSLFLIAWRNMQQRGFATFLTMLSMTLGVALVGGMIKGRGAQAEGLLGGHRVEFW